MLSAAQRRPIIGNYFYLMVQQYLSQGWHVCMVITCMYQPGKVANPVRGQLSRENKLFPVPVRAREFGPARWVRPSRPASVCSFSTLKLNHGIAL